MGGNPKESTPALKQVLVAAHAGLMAAAIMAAGGGGGNTSTREAAKQKPDTLQESLSRMSEDRKRDPRTFAGSHGRARDGNRSPGQRDP